MNDYLLLCNKYNLVTGLLQNYIGAIPDKNLEDIKLFNQNIDQHKISLNKDSTGYSIKFLLNVGIGRNLNFNKDQQEQVKNFVSVNRFLYDSYEDNMRN